MSWLSYRRSLCDSHYKISNLPDLAFLSTGGPRMHWIPRTRPTNPSNRILSLKPPTQETQALKYYSFVITSDIVWVLLGFRRICRGQRLLAARDEAAPLGPGHERHHGPSDPRQILFLGGQRRRGNVENLVPRVWLLDALSLENIMRVCFKLIFLFFRLMLSVSCIKIDLC